MLTCSVFQTSQVGFPLPHIAVNETWFQQYKLIEQNLHQSFALKGTFNWTVQKVVCSCILRPGIFCTGHFFTACSHVKWETLHPFGARIHGGPRI